jgi:hypothetical protein
VTFPTSVDTADELYTVVNTFYATVQTFCTSSDTSIVITSYAGLQATGGIVAIGTELIAYASINTAGIYPILTGCTRGFSGTAASAHQAGEVVELRWVAEHHNALVTAIRAIETALGLIPATDGLNGITFTSLADRLANNLPKQASFTATTSWVITHSRKRAVVVQCYENTGGGNYQLITPTAHVQNINPSGSSTVTLTFATNKTGYAIYV